MAGGIHLGILFSFHGHIQSRFPVRNHHFQHIGPAQGQLCLFHPVIAPEAGKEFLPIDIEDIQGFPCISHLPDFLQGHCRISYHLQLPEGQPRLMEQHIGSHEQQEQRRRAARALFSRRRGLLFSGSFPESGRFLPALLLISSCGISWGSWGSCCSRRARKVSRPAARSARAWVSWASVRP